MVSSAYLRLLIFLPAILIPVCASSSLTVHMLFSAYKLNKQGAIYSLHVLLYNLEPVHCSMSSLNCCFLICMPEKAMAPHSGTFAWKIPWMEEPGRLQSMGSLRVGHDWATSLSLFTFMHWRKWQPTPVFLPGESQGRGSLVAAVYGVTQSQTRLKWLSIA